MFVRAKTSFKMMSKEKEELILLEVSLRIIAFKTLNKSCHGCEDMCTSAWRDIDTLANCNKVEHDKI